jgi:hypothetical protein
VAPEIVLVDLWGFFFQVCPAFLKLPMSSFFFVSMLRIGRIFGEKRSFYNDTVVYKGYLIIYAQPLSTVLEVHTLSDRSKNNFTFLRASMCSSTVVGFYGD